MENILGVKYELSERKPRSDFDTRKLSGVYKIQSKSMDMAYIGSSTDVFSRINCHRSKLRNNLHFNQDFQDAFNALGIDDFYYEILELCSEDDLEAREQYWINEAGKEIDLANKRYGVADYRKHHTAESRAKMRKKWDYDKHWTTSAREAMSQSVKGENNPMYGKKQSAYSNAANTLSNLENMYKRYKERGVCDYSNPFFLYEIEHNVDLSNDELRYIVKYSMAETDVQQSTLELIASENYPSKNVKAILGSDLGDKYSEGMPGGFKYYGGQQNLEAIELKTIDLAKRLFHADHANVQPHAGAQANMAVYNAWCEPGDTILGLSLDDGGHLTHGSPVTQAAKFYNFVSYGLDENGYIDLEDLKNKIVEYQPKIILIGYSAYSRIPDFGKINQIRNEYAPEALLMADMAHVAGLIAGGVHPNPLEYGFNVMTTTTHKSLRGPRGGLILSMGKVSNPLKKPEHTLENIPTLIDRSVFPGTQGGPLMHCIAAKAICFAEAMTPEFKEYAEQILKNAKAMESVFRERAVYMQTGGTDNHLILINAKKSFGKSGKEAEKILEDVGIIVNKNAVHNDTGTKANPDGIRLGTPAITTRGFDEEDCKVLANCICDVLSDAEKYSDECRKTVKNLALHRVIPSLLF